MRQTRLRSSPRAISFTWLIGNGGGVMRGDSVAAVWPTLEIIRDIYSQASQGVVLTWVTLWDAKVAFRAAAYERVAFKIG